MHNYGKKTGWFRKSLKVDAAFGIDVVGMDEGLQNDFDRLYGANKLKRIKDISAKRFVAAGSGGLHAEEYFRLHQQGIML